jgi:hypothetical protein
MLRKKRHATDCRAIGALCLFVMVVLADWTQAAPAQHRTVGVLRTAGQNVLFNGHPAQDRTPVFEGDKVTTGAASSARIDLAGGGFVQLDEQTDPVFVWQRVRGGVCLVVRIFSGRAYAETPGGCHVYETPIVTAFARGTEPTDADGSGGGGAAAGGGNAGITHTGHGVDKGADHEKPREEQLEMRRGPDKPPLLSGAAATQMEVYKTSAKLLVFEGKMLVRLRGEIVVRKSSQAVITRKGAKLTQRTLSAAELTAQKAWMANYAFPAEPAPTPKAKTGNQGRPEKPDRPEIERPERPPDRPPAPTGRTF